MIQMSFTYAETLDPAQATELVKVLELQSAWESTKVDPRSRNRVCSVEELNRRQRTFEEYRVRLDAYCQSFWSTRLPVLSSYSLDRLRTWCESLRVLLQKAESGVSTKHLTEMTYQAADRIAARMNRLGVERQSSEHPDAAIQGLNAVIAWCVATPVSVEKDAIQKVA